MDIQDLQQRIIAINDEMTQTQALYKKLEGHLAETHHWLGVIIRKEQEKADAEKEKLETAKLLEENPDGMAVMDCLEEENLGEQGNGEADDQAKEQAPQE